MTLVFLSADPHRGFGFWSARRGSVRIRVRSPFCCNSQSEKHLLIFALYTVNIFGYIFQCPSRCVFLKAIQQNSSSLNLSCFIQIKCTFFLPECLSKILFQKIKFKKELRRQFFRVSTDKILKELTLESRKKGSSRVKMIQKVAEENIIKKIVLDCLHE